MTRTAPTSDRSTLRSLLVDYMELDLDDFDHFDGVDCEFDISGIAETLEHWGTLNADLAGFTYGLHRDYDGELLGLNVGVQVRGANGGGFVLCDYILLDSLLTGSTGVDLAFEMADAFAGLYAKARETAEAQGFAIGPDPAAAH